MEIRSGAVWDENAQVFRLPYFGWLCEVGHADGEVSSAATNLTIWDKVVIVRYLTNASGTPRLNRWISFPQISGGQSHWHLVQKEVLEPLAARYGWPGDSPDRTRNERTVGMREFYDVIQSLGGCPAEFGDMSGEFDVLPRVRVCVVIWKGDDEFAPSANVLFDESVKSYLEMADAYFVCERLAREFGIRTGV